MGRSTMALTGSTGNPLDRISKARRPGASCSAIILSSDEELVALQLPVERLPVPSRQAYQLPPLSGPRLKEAGEPLVGDRRRGKTIPAARTK